MYIPLVDQKLAVETKTIKERAQESDRDGEKF